MAKPSIAGQGIDILFKPNQNHTKQAVKITFRVPPKLASEFENVANSVKNSILYQTITKNQLGTIALQQIVRQWKDLKEEAPFFKKYIRT